MLKAKIQYIKASCSVTWKSKTQDIVEYERKRERKWITEKTKEILHSSTPKQKTTHKWMQFQQLGFISIKESQSKHQHKLKRTSTERRYRDGSSLWDYMSVKKCLL